MNILIDIRYLETPHTGIAVGLKAFLDKLERIRPKHMIFYLIYNDKNIYKDSNYYKSIQINNKLFSIKEHFELYKIFKKYDIDIFYSHHFVSPLFRIKKLRTINIIHDLIPLHIDVLSFIGKIYYYVMNFYTMKKSDVIVANSYATKEDIKRFFKRSNVKVFYHSFNRKKLQDFDDKIIEKLGLKDKQYFLFVSSLKKHKNYDRVIEAFKKLNDDNISLVFVGKKDNELDIEIQNIIFTNYISDKELNSLYKNSSGVVFPSLIEGFGVPILEAWYHGVPVITSNFSSMKEIAGDGAVLVNPNNIEEISEAMKKVLDNKFRLELTLKGTKNLQKFSWKEYTENIIMIFKGLK